MEYANVIVDISHEKLDRVFQYRIPEHLKEHLKTGMQVQFPFGNGNRLMKGYVVGFTDTPDYPPEKIKELDRIMEGGVRAESQLIAMAAWMKERYGSTMNQALKTVLPVKQEIAEKKEVRLRLIVSKEQGEALLKDALHKNFRAKARLLAALLDHGGVLDKKEAADRYKVTAPVIRKFEEVVSLCRSPGSSIGIHLKDILSRKKEQCCSRRSSRRQWMESLVNTRKESGRPIFCRE